MESRTDSADMDFATLTVTANYTTNQTATPVVKNWAALCALPIIAFVATGNVLVILAVKMDHKLRSSTNYFLTSLAVADLLVAITVMPPSLAMIINNYSWPFPKELCGIWQMLDVCFSTASILHLCMISLDRYMALAKPFRYTGGGWMSRNTSSSAGGWATDKRGNSKWLGSGLGSGASKLTKRVAKRILLVWILSLGIALPLPILGHNDPNNIFIGEMCVINIPEFTIYGSLVAFFLPLVAMFITYSLTIRTLQKQSKHVRDVMSKGGSSTHRGRPSMTPTVTSRQSLKMTSQGSIGGSRSLLNKRLSSGVSDRRNPSLPDIWVTTNNGRRKRADSAVSGISFQSTHNEGRIKTCALLCCFSSNRTEPPDELEMTQSEYDDEWSKSARPKSDSDDSESGSAQNQSLSATRSPMLVRANMTFSKVVSKFPINRLSTRRLSASVKGRAIANEQRASKVLGMIFTLFCIFWCPFFITNTFSGICEQYGLTCNMELMGNLMNWFVWVGYVSSGVNPCVYTLFSQHFRETFRKLACCRWQEIGHRGLARNFSRDRGFSTSSFHYDAPDSRDAAVRSETTATVRRANGDKSHFLVAENTVIRQHKRIQVTRSADSGNLLSENSPTPCGDKLEPSRHQKVQWRSTWHYTINENGDADPPKTRNTEYTCRTVTRVGRNRRRGRRSTLGSYTSMKDGLLLEDSIAEDENDSEVSEEMGKTSSVTFAARSGVTGKRQQQNLTNEARYPRDARRATFHCGSGSSGDENENNNNLNAFEDDLQERGERRLLQKSREMRVRFSPELSCKVRDENENDFGVFSDDTGRRTDRQFLPNSPRIRVRFSPETPCKACAAYSTRSQAESLTIPSTNTCENNLDLSSSPSQTGKNARSSPTGNFTNNSSKRRATLPKSVIKTECI